MKNEQLTKPQTRRTSKRVFRKAVSRSGAKLTFKFFTHENNITTNKRRFEKSRTKIQ